MVKKYFYRPAQLKKGKQRWQIIFHVLNVETGKFERFRETWDINRISDLKERERHAAKIIQRLNRELLPNGYPHNQPPTTGGPIIAEAVKFATDLKINSGKEETARTYKGVVSVFFKFIEAEKLASNPISSFSKKHVAAFSDWLIVERKVSGRTHNKYLGHLHSVFAELTKREILQANPFSKAERRKQTAAKIRTFTREERIVVAAEIQRAECWLWYWVLLQYHCFIRGRELRRLQFKDFDLQEGTIFLDASKTKNGKPRHCTIPKAVLPEFQKPDFAALPANYLIFGYGLEPHPCKPVGVNTANLRHSQILEKLKKSGVLADTSGLSVYSWKYTGISEDVNDDEMKITDVQMQADHHSPTQTLAYHRKPKVNARYRESTRHILK